MKTKRTFFTLLVLVLSFSSCTKDALNKKTDIHLVVASSLDDYQQLLNGILGGVITNGPGLFSYQAMGEYLSDNVYVTDTYYNKYFQSSIFVTSVIKWDKNLFSSLSTLAEWNNTYKIVLNANVILEGLNSIKVTSDNQKQINQIKGAALLIRAQMFYNIAQFWSPPYQSSSASTDLGVVLRLSPDSDIVSVRSTNAVTYQQIISDLTAAADLLSDISSQNTRLSKITPSKAGAYGLLARTYLAMGDYPNVVKYSNAALELYSSLIDYNSLVSSPTTRFFNTPGFNSEIVFFTSGSFGTVTNTFGYWISDPNLVNSYDSNDLRKQLYFNPDAGGMGFLPCADDSGSDGLNFNGIAVDELYLLRAEEYARTGNVQSAVSDINTLLIKRYKTGTYTPYTASSADDALAKILVERRKEFVQRGLRWPDLRRLNQDKRFATTPTRTLLGVTYTLPPNNSRYTLQIPNYVIAASNGSIAQNP